MHWCWERAARRQGLELRTFHLPLMPRRDEEILDAVAAALSPRTRLVFFSHVYSATGLIVPAAEICDLIHRHGAISVVDGAHAPAMIPLDIEAIGCDFYCGNCHKWLLAPIGAGFLVLGSTPPIELEPLQVSWGFKPDRDRWDEPDEFGSTPRTRFLEFEGTRDPCAWLAVPEAIDFQSSIGWDAIRERMHQLSAHTRKRLDGRAGLRLTTPMDPKLHGAMTAYWWPGGTDAETIRRRLWDRRIEALVGEWPEGATLRVSNHFYNTESEIDRLADAIPEILPGG
jgi:isopenicillin-N epimerase